MATNPRRNSADLASIVRLSIGDMAFIDLLNILPAEILSVPEQTRARIWRAILGQVLTGEHRPAEIIKCLNIRVISE